MYELHRYALQELKDTYDEKEVGALCVLLFRDIFKYTNIDIHLRKHEQLPERFINKFLQIVMELKTDKPIQYILGETEFAGLRFGLNADTLVPRPETEELVQWILESGLSSGERVLDVGTGSGCIAVSLAHSVSGLNVEAVDISPEAIGQAEKNARMNRVDVDFCVRDITRFDHYEWGCYDLIVSNPPYVRVSEKALMHNRVLNYEPHRALFVPDEDPLAFYRVISGFGLEYLKPGGRLFFEINEAFGSETVSLLEKYGYREVELKQDIFGKERFVKGRKI